MSKQRTPSSSRLSSMECSGHGLQRVPRWLGQLNLKRLDLSQNRHRQVGSAHLTFCVRAPPFWYKFGWPRMPGGLRGLVH